MSNGRFRAGRHLLQARSGDEIVLLDLKRGEYVLFDQVAAAMWDALRSSAVEADAIARLTAMFDVDESRLAPDLDRFRQRCATLGLLDDDPEAAAPRRTARPSRFPAIRAWRYLRRTARQLKRMGFARTYSRITASAPVLPGPPGPALLERAEKAFARAEDLFVARSAPDDCLPRSLALFDFLRSMGVAAEHRFGFERYPFAAHAWVESGGRVILDEDRRDRLIPLLPIS